MRDIRMKHTIMEYRMFKNRPIVEVRVTDEITKLLESVEERIFKISGLHPKHTTQKAMDISLFAERLDKKSALTLAMLYSLRIELKLLEQHVREWRNAKDPIFLVEADTIKAIKFEIPDESEGTDCDIGFFRTLTNCYTISGRHFEPIPYRENDYKVICYVYLPTIDSIIEEATTAAAKISKD